MNILYDLSYNILIPSNDLSETFLYIKNNTIIDISLQYNTLIPCISGVTNMIDMISYIRNRCYTVSGISLYMDISFLIIEPSISFTNGSLISQFTERLDNTKTHFECISGDIIQMILNYTVYSSQNIIITNKFNNSDTSPILNTPNITFIRPVQKEFSEFANVPNVRVLLTLVVV
jgi:hypothetical protein